MDFFSFLKGQLPVPPDLQPARAPRCPGFGAAHSHRTFPLPRKPSHRCCVAWFNAKIRIDMPQGITTIFSVSVWPLLLVIRT